jgi:type II secretory pathway component PulC
VKEPVEAPEAALAAPSGIARRELLAFLDRGPGEFLGHVDVSPRFGSGHFQGWRLRSFYPGDQRFAGLDLQAGDVVLRVNGRSVEKPEQLTEVWQALRAAEALEVDLERNGAPIRLRWPIHP